MLGVIEPKTEKREENDKPKQQQATGNPFLFAELQGRSNEFEQTHSGRAAEKKTDPEREQDAEYGITFPPSAGLPFDVIASGREQLIFTADGMLGYKSQKDFIRAYGIIFIIALVGFSVRMAKFQQLGVSMQLTLLLVTLLFIPVFWEALRFINRYLNKKYPFEENLTGRVTLQLFLGAGVGLLARALIYFFGEPHLPFELDALFIATTWALYPLMTVAVNLGFFTSYFIERWKDGLLKTAKLEQEKSQVQFNNLKNQLNPHFLFNALTSLNSLIFDDQKLASEFLQQLSKVYRYLLQNEDKNSVSLATELNFIEHYISLLHTRFGSALKIGIEVDSASLQRAVVPVTLQILIENALKHNIVDPNKPLHIDVLTIGDYLVVSNNLQPKKLVENSNKRGLNDLGTLYGYLTQQPLLVEATADRFFVKVPLL